MAAPTATVNGTPVNFGFTGTNGFTPTGLSGTLLQNAEITNEGDCEVTRDGNGAEVTHGWYNFHLGSTLEWVVTGTSLAAAITNSSISSLTPGAFVSISACTSMPQLVGNWEVQAQAKVSGSNTTSKKISVPLKLFGGITAVAT